MNAFKRLALAASFLAVLCALASVARQGTARARGLAPFVSLRASIPTPTPPVMKEGRNFVAVGPDLTILSAKKIGSDKDGIKIEVQIKNAGIKDAGPFELACSCDWQPKEPPKPGEIGFGGTISVNYPPILGLASKQTKTLSYFCARQQPKASRVIFKAVLDAKNEVEETNESNNKYQSILSPK